MPAMTSPEAIQRRPSRAHFHFYIRVGSYSTYPGFVCAKLNTFQTKDLRQDDQGGWKNRTEKCTQTPFGFARGRQSRDDTRRCWCEADPV